MIGFSIEFKKFYFVLRGPKGRVYLATGFAKRMPVMTPTGTYSMHDLIGDDIKYGTYRCDLAAWPSDETDDELPDTLEDMR